jgi:hypothetical protein
LASAAGAAAVAGAAGVAAGLVAISSWVEHDDKANVTEMAAIPAAEKIIFI